MVQDLNSTLSVSKSMAARLIGSGFGISSSDSEEPLDVDYNKLAEWLVSGLQC